MKKRRTYPGSIFPDKGKLYIKFKGKKFSTGLEPTKAGYQRAEQKLEQLWLAFNRLDDTFNIQRIRIADAFERFLETKINRYEKTITTYKLAYRAVITENYYLETDRIEKDVQKYFATTSHGAVSKNTYLTHLQVFLNFCTKKGWIPKTNFKSEYKSKINDNNVIFWTEQQVQQLISHFIVNGDKEIAHLIEFMTETGARVVDCLTLEAGQIKGSIIIWRNKITKKPEPRPISTRAKQILATLPAREHIWKWTYSGKSFLNRKLREACEILEIDRGARSFQEFRVTFRMKLLNRGVPPDYIMYLMRHKDRKVTEEFYTYYDADYIKKYLDTNKENMTGKVE